MPITRGEEFMMIDTTSEAVAGVKNGTQTKKPFRVVGGGIGIKESPEFIDTEEHANSAAQPAPFISGFKPKGSLNVIPSPYDSTTVYGTNSEGLFKFLLGRAHTRTSGRLASHSIYHAVPSILTREFLGCKVNGYSLGWGSGSKRLDASFDILGLNAGKLSSTFVTGDCGTLPSSRDWLVSLISLQIGASTSVVTSTRTLSDLNLAFTNNLSQVGDQYWYPSGRTTSPAYGAMDIHEGEQVLTGSVGLRLDDDTWLGRLEAGTLCALRILGFHKDSLAFTSSGSFSTTSNPTVTIAEDYTTGQITVGDYVYLEDTTAADPSSWLREVLRVKAVTPTGAGGTNSIQLETDGSTDSASLGRTQSFTAGTKIKTLGFQYLVSQLTVLDWDLSGGVREQGIQKIPFRASITGSTPLATYLLR